jgi:hypothetical protein
MISHYGNVLGKKKGGHFKKWKEQAFCFLKCLPSASERLNNPTNTPPAFPHFEAIQLDETQFLNPWNTFMTLNFGEVQ